jgi:hypothetical protein
MVNISKKFTGTILLGIVICAMHASSVLAVRATFKQQIFPLNCVFQQVNDGAGTVIFITPKECGVIVQPKPGKKKTPAQSQVQQQLYPNKVVFFVPASGGNMSESTPVSSHLPWQPIATIAQNNSQNNSSESISGWLWALVATVVVGLIFLLVFVIF